MKITDFINCWRHDVAPPPNDTEKYNVKICIFPKTITKGEVYTSQIVARVSWEENYITIVSFAITFVIIVIIIASIGKVLTKIADFASLGLLNKLLGGVFGALKIGLVLSIILLVLNKLNNTIPFVSEEQQENAILYEPVKDLAPTLFPDFLNVVEEETDFDISE